MFNKKLNPEQGEPTHTPTTSGPTETRAPSPRPAESKAPAPTPAPSGGGSTVLAEGAKFVGKANVAGTFRVEGLAEGDIQASDNLVVAKTGNVEAKVTTRRAVLNGKFQGRIEASDRVEMQAGSRVQADIKARNMVMEDGVQFRGGCEIGK